MHLLDTASFELHEFFGNSIPEYAILSHTWAEEEVLFEDVTHAWDEDQDYPGSLRMERTQKKAGYSKITKACALAKSHDYQYIWIDTCCIDKKSSAELSEAINSMFRWYHDAAVCFAYLADVSITISPASEMSFIESRWFKRGWTLQELLAPSDVSFFDMHWRYFGTRMTLHPFISAATTISPLEILFFGKSYGSGEAKPSIAARMSWAAARQTSRVEDMAYCLMGIFDINMPLLYGEGQKAFLRLQEELIKKYDDESIYAWAEPDHQNYLKPYESRVGMLAPSPAEFAHSGDIIAIDPSSYRQVPLTVTNRGLSLSASFREGERRFCKDGILFEKRVTSVIGFAISEIQCYETPLACMHSAKSKAPVKLTICVDKSGKTFRPCTPRLAFCDLDDSRNLVSNGFQMSSFYVPLDTNYEARWPADRIPSASIDRLILALTPKAKLRLVDVECLDSGWTKQDDRRGEYTWQRQSSRDPLKIRLRIDGEHQIELMWQHGWIPIGVKLGHQGKSKNTAASWGPETPSMTSSQYGDSMLDATWIHTGDSHTSALDQDCLLLLNLHGGSGEGDKYNTRLHLDILPRHG